MKLLDRWNNNIVLKLASFNSLHIAIKLILGAVMSKIIAIYAGTAGIALMGNLQNVLQGTQTFAVLGQQHGIVKYSSQYRDDRGKLRIYLSTAGILSLIAGCITALTVFLTASWLSEYLFKQDYSNVIRLLAISLPFYIIFAFISGVLQGFEKYKKYVILQILVSIVVFIVAAYLLMEYEVTGALYSIVITPIIQTIIAIVLIKIAVPGLAIRNLLQFRFDMVVARKFAKYSVMALVSALLLPAVMVMIRNYLMEQSGDDAAGCWQGMMRISSYYMMFSTTLIAMYVLPSLSKEASYANFRKTTFHFLKTILPLIFLGMIMVYVFRDLVVTYLFTEEFAGMEPLFKWQLLGDFIKVITTVFAFEFIARNDIKRYLIAELISIASFYILSRYLIPINGASGVVQAHLITYVIYLIALLVLLRKELFSKIA